MGAVRHFPWRRVLPWVVSTGLLAYVFGWATDWRALVDATREAHLPLFVAITFSDKMIFFLAWTLLQASAIRRFVTPVRVAEVVSVRGGSELLRAVSNPLADAAFLLGLSQVARGRVEAVIAAALIPFLCHVVVLLLQATLALPLLPGGPEAHRDVAGVVAVGWAGLAGVALAMRTAPSFSRRVPGIRFLVSLLDRLSIRRMLPFVAWFFVLAAFDVLIQGLASRAFGVPIAWAALVARIPLLYLALSIPSLGNYGTRELTWAALFGEYGARDTLIAYAFATNTLFLVFNVLIGVVFLPRALALVAEVRRAQREGEPVPEPLLRDASDP